MQRVIGLDIGSYSIKAVEIVNNINSYEIRRFYETVIPTIEELSSDVVIPACMRQLFRENDIRADRIITAMPGQYVSGRLLSFAFSDPQKIKLAVNGEIEDAVPYNLEEMISDHQILGNEDGKTVVLVVMTRANFLGSFIEHLQKSDIDPKLIDVDSLAFYNLIPHMDLESSKCFGLVDIGHEKTSVCLVREGMLKMFRTINIGGRFVTEFLARDFELSFGDAEKEKHRVSQVICSTDDGSSLSQRDREIADRMTIALSSIMKELGRTFYAFKTWEKQPVDEVLISGGGSLIKGIDRVMEDQLGVTVGIARLDESSLKIHDDLRESTQIMAQGIAIGMRATTSAKRLSQINLRRGPYAYVQNYENVFRIGGNVVKYAVVAAVLLVGCYFMQSHIYTAQTKGVRGKFERGLLATFPDNYTKKALRRKSIQALRRDLKVRAEEASKTHRGLIDDFVLRNSKSGSLVVLKELSEVIPKDVEVDITEFEFRADEKNAAGGRVVIEGDTDGFDSYETIRSKIEGMSSLKEVRESADPKEKIGSKEKKLTFALVGEYATHSDSGN